MRAFSTQLPTRLFAGVILSLSLALPLEAQTPAAPEIVEIDRIVAVVNDDVIVNSELQARLKTVTEQLNKSGWLPNSAGMAVSRKLRGMVETTLSA